MVRLSRIFYKYFPNLSAYRELLGIPNMKRFLHLLVALIIPVAMNAQIGYQVALMDQSTGKPRANETVSVTVTISDNSGKVICSETSSATTNNFGMLALQVGDPNTFNAVDWSKLPLWVSATVGGVTVGKTQILNIPVAEHANHWGTLTKDILTSKTWRSGYDNNQGSDWHTLSFSSDGSCVYKSYRHGDGKIESAGSTCNYIISNDAVCLDFNDHGFGEVYIYFKDKNILAGGSLVFR